MLRILAFLLLLITPLTAPQPPGKIAFVRGGNLWLWEAGRERQVTRTGDVANPQISPSGRYVAFEQGGRLLVTAAGGGDLWAVEPSGYARWAPTDDTLAVDIAAGVATVPVSDQGPESIRLIAMGWHSPAWAPDGSALAVARGEPGNTMARGTVTLAVVARTGGQPRTVATERYDENTSAVGATPLAWSADGRWLAYGRYGRTASISADYNEVMVVPVAGGEAVKVAETPRPHWSAWAPAGATLAVTDGAGRMVWQNKVVKLVPMPPSESAQSLTPPGYSDREPAWSPDGRFLAFTRSRAESAGNMDQPYPEQHIEVAAPDLGRTFAARGSEGAVAPQWGPGNSMLWVRPDQQTVWYLNRPDEEPAPLIRNIDLTSSYYGQWPVRRVLDWWRPGP